MNSKTKIPFFQISIVLTLVLTIIFLIYKFRPIYSYLFSINIVAFVFYGLDKLLSKIGKNKENPIRVPEKVLHFTSLIFGSAGAFAGQAFFRHKTIKKSFRVKFISIVVLQIVIVGVLLYYKV